MASAEHERADHAPFDKRLRQIAESVRRLSSLRVEGELERELLSTYAQITGSTGGSFYVLEGRSLRRVTSIDGDHAPLILTLPLRRRSIFEHVLSTALPILIPDLAATSEYVSSGWDGYKSSSLLALPVVDDRHRFLGLLALHDKHGKTYTAGDLDAGSILVSAGLVAIDLIRSATALRESESLYREVFEKTSDGLFVDEVTPDGRFRTEECNPAQARMLGISAPEASGKFLEEYLPRGALDVAIVHNRRVMEAGVPLTFEADVELPFGRSYFLTTLVPARDATGRIHRLIGVTRDTTEYRRIQDELKESEEKFSKAFHGSPDPIVISRIEDAVIVEVNQGFLKATGYTRDQVLGHSTLAGDLNLWVDIEDRARFVSQVTEHGEAVGEMLRFRRKDGRILYALVSWTLIEIRGMRYLLSILRDMTERVFMEKAIEESESRFRLLAENSTDLISRHDPQGLFLYASPACTQLLGYEQVELVGRSILELAHEEDLDTLRESHKRTLESSTADTASYRIRRKDGSFAWFETISRAIRAAGAGTVIEIQCASRDISDRILAQERDRENEQRLFQAARLASLGTLVSGIAHEINNPNYFIRLNSQNLQEFWPDIRAVLDEKDKEGLSLRGIPYRTARGLVDDLLNGLGEGSRRIEKLVQNLRDFARGDEGEMDESLDLNAVVRSAIMIVQNLVQQSTGNFSVRETPILPAIRGNYYQLEEVVINLVTNACQALTSRSGRVIVETLNIADEDFVELRVSDEGVGIPTENLPRLLDPFFTTKGKGGGSGLGLPMTARIVKNHGGTMSFTSEVGKGTTVTVRLPASGRS